MRVAGARRLASWTVLACALIAYVALGLAEEGARGSGIEIAPASPLPFPRHEVFGIDLRAYSSLEALDWLNAAGREPLPLVMLPVDGDVVLALSRDDLQSTAIAALDALVQATGGSPAAVCLRTPVDTEELDVVAADAVRALTERYPNQIAYVSACDGSTAGWRRDVAAATVLSELLDVTVSSPLIPLAAGEPLRIAELDGHDSLGSSAVSGLPDGVYSLVSVPVNAPLSQELIDDAEQLLRNDARVALFVAAPEPGLDPSTLVASLLPALVEGETLPEGFSSVTAPSIGLSGAWQPNPVGTTAYLRATTTGPVLFADFVGTDVSLVAILSPDAGRVHAWIDPETDSGAPPDVTVDLSADQAQDAALPLFADLPAARHRVIVQVEVAEGETVALSGLFVTGKPAPAWTEGLAGLALIAVATAALAERSWASIDSIRAARPRGHRRALGSEHPRGFGRH